MFNKDQLFQIELGIQQGLDVSWYAKECFDWMQMCEIRYGLEQEVDISIYAKECFERHQMAVIRTGLDRGVDVTSYTNPEIHWLGMRDILFKLLGEKNNV